MMTVLNPNSSDSVTQAISEAVAGLQLPRASFRVAQLDTAPRAIQTAADVAAAAELVVGYVRQLSEDDILIVGCHSDPGVLRAREEGVARVIGIGEASMLAACAFGRHFGVVSLDAEAVDRKWQMVEHLGLSSRCAAIEATGTTVLHGVKAQLDITPYLNAAHKAVEQGAQVLVLGCGGMVRVASELERRIGIPVIEPIRAACLIGFIV